MKYMKSVKFFENKKNIYAIFVFFRGKFRVLFFLQFPSLEFFSELGYCWVYYFVG